MPDKTQATEASYPEPTLRQEIAALGDDDLMELMNLGTRRTGIKGTIFVSTAMGSHGPHIKYFEKTGPGQQSFSVSIEASPSVMSNSLPERVCTQMAPQVISWVRLNRDPLLRLWNAGQFWSEEEVGAFQNALQKVTDS